MAEMRTAMQSARATRRKGAICRASGGAEQFKRTSETRSIHESTATPASADASVLTLDRTANLVLLRDMLPVIVREWLSRRLSCVLRRGVSSFWTRVTDDVLHWLRSCRYGAENDAAWEQARRMTDEKCAMIREDQYMWWILYNYQVLTGKIVAED